MIDKVKRWKTEKRSRALFAFQLIRFEARVDSEILMALFLFDVKFNMKEK